jgi:hypothetical protein
VFLVGSWGLLLSWLLSIRINVNHYYGLLLLIQSFQLFRGKFYLQLHLLLPGLRWGLLVPRRSVAISVEFVLLHSFLVADLLAEQMLQSVLDVLLVFG